MRCVHIAAELAPIAKVGGLGDVLLGLGRELSWKGQEVNIIIPKYDCMDSHEIGNLEVDTSDFPCYFKGKEFLSTIWTGWVENLKVYFIDPHHPRYFFGRGCFYGCDDDIERFLCFARTAIEFLYKQDIRPDIIHLHDWQAAVIAPLYRDIYKPLGYKDSKIVFTIHNMEYQGKCSAADLDSIGLQGKEYLTADRLQDNLFPETINLLKGGIVYSDYVTTVSPTYAKEVKTSLFGQGMESTLIQHANKFEGVLNGLDYSYWNPEIDRYLPVHFSSRERPANSKDSNTLDKKAYLKKIFREEFLNARTHKPLVGCVTRLVPQKGIELIKEALYYTIEHGGQFVLLGSSPIPSIDAEFQELKQHLSSNSDVHLVLHHQEDFAHQVFAASDMFIVPSLFEPCGLTQLISLKYGAVPIVRRTGGLADTIFDVDHSQKPFNQTNGYTFDSPNKQGIDSALQRAFEMWFQQPDRWHHLMVNGMNMDYSWNIPSNAYLGIYYKIMGKSAG